MPSGSVVKHQPAIQETQETWVVFPGGRHSLQYSCQENSMDRKAWQGTVQGVQSVEHD